MWEFKATHKLTILVQDFVIVHEVMLLDDAVGDGPAYRKSEWLANKDPVFARLGGKWLFQDRVLTQPHTVVELP